MAPGRFFIDVDMALEPQELRSKQGRLCVQGEPRAELLSRHIHSLVLQEHGPAGGNALVRLKSARKRLVQYLADMGYDLSCHHVQAL